MPQETLIRSVNCESDAGDICRIYNYFIENTFVTFEDTPLAEPAMAVRIRDIVAEFPYFVAEQDGEILGFAYAARWKTRAAYRYSLESTIYLKPGCDQKGLGTALYTRLIDTLAAADYHSVVGGIALPNKASVALHEKLGFEKIGQFKEIGFKQNQWIDVGYWQKILGK